METGDVIMGTQFKHKESYKHLFAKSVLAGWFQKIEEKCKDFCQLGQFHWRANYGVYTELPFHTTSDEYYFECSGGLLEDGQGFDPKFDRGPILFVPDVTVFHKGSPVYLLEVVHTSHVSTDKLSRIKRFFSNHPSVYEVDANFILTQISMPPVIECKQIL